MPSALVNDFQEVAAIKSPTGTHIYKHGVMFGHMETVRAPATHYQFAPRYKHGSLGNAAQLGVFMQIAGMRQVAATEKWTQHLLNRHASVDVDAITETVEGVLDALAEFGPGSLHLRDFRPDAVQGEHLAAVLRASSTWKDEVSGWTEAIGVAKAALITSGADPEDVLFGMNF